MASDGNGSNHSNHSWPEVDSRWCYVEGASRPYDCIRISLMVILAIITGAFCLARVIQYHCYKAKNYHQYLVYYTALLICVMSVIHWGYVTTPVLDLIITYLIVVQLLVISWFFYSWAFRILQQEKLFNYLILPLQFIILMYYTACLIWASIKVSDITTECAEPQWLLFTSSQLVHVQFFLFSVIYITKKLNDIRTMRTNRFSQKAQLWGLAIMYEVVSITAFSYDIYFLVSRSLDHECGTKFSVNPVGGTVLYIFHKLIKYFVPQLTICVIFAPLKTRPQSMDQEFEETDTLSWANRSNYQSTFYTSSTNTPHEGKENDTISPFSINTNSSSNPILPRTISSSSSYPNSPWIIPGRSWTNNVNGKMESPSLAGKKVSPSLTGRTNLSQGHS